MYAPLPFPSFFLSFFLSAALPSFLPSFPFSENSIKATVIVFVQFVQLDTSGHSLFGSKKNHKVRVHGIPLSFFLLTDVAGEDDDDDDAGGFVGHIGIRREK